MKPDISEFSYGFALTSELLQSFGSPIVAAPVFPSLIAEGQAGGGWDVQISRPSAPLFLQFKLADFMKKSTCREGAHGFPLPCYRMYLRRAGISQQHQLLLDLEASGEQVYYTAPTFHRPKELNETFVSGQIRARSMWLSPSAIGPLQDTKEHHVSFRPGGPWAFFSERRDLKPFTFDVVAKQLADRVRERGVAARDRQFWEHLGRSLIAVLERRGVVARRFREQAESSANLHPVERVARYASMFLETQLYLVHTQEST